MDATSQAHTQRFMNNSIKNREAEAMYRTTHFPVDADGNMVFDNGGWVTRRKKAFKQNTMYFKAANAVALSDKSLTLVPSYIEESNPERENRIVLCVKVDISKPLEEIYCFFSQAGQIRSAMISVDEIQRNYSVEIEFYSFKSVAVAMALAVKYRQTNICAKAENIQVDSNSFPVEETEITRGGTLQSSRDAFPDCQDVASNKIYIGFSHIPVTVDWLEKIFQVFDVVEIISLPRPINHVHLGRALLQFQSINGVQDAIRLSKQLKLSNKNAEVKMEVTAFDGTEWLRDGTLHVPVVAVKADDSWK